MPLGPCAAALSASGCKSRLPADPHLVPLAHVRARRPAHSPRLRDVPRAGLRWGPEERPAVLVGPQMPAVGPIGPLGQGAVLGRLVVAALLQSALAQGLQR